MINAQCAELVLRTIPENRHGQRIAEAKTGAGGRYGKCGDLLYRWGNPSAHKNGPPDDQIVFWAHDSYWLNDEVPHAGDIMIFNNGGRRGADGKPNPDEICMGMLSYAYSDVLEVKFPRREDGFYDWDSGSDIVWSYNRGGKVAFYSPFMSGAQRMPNGNTLMMQGCDKRIVEVTPDGEMVLDFHLAGPGRMFRIYKYTRDYPGLNDYL